MTIDTYPRLREDDKIVFSEGFMKKQNVDTTIDYRIAMVSLYPKHGELYSEGTTGVASYAKNTVAHMSQQVLVVADYQTRPESYIEKNAHILRCFKRNTYFMWREMYRHIIMYPQIKDVIIQFDPALYGSIFLSGLIIPFLALFKRKRIRTYVVNHSVVTDVRRLKGHVGIGNSIFDVVKSAVYNLLFHLFYTLLGVVAHKIIVLEEPLKTKLETYVPTQKVIAIPHAVDTKLVPHTKTWARKKLGLPENDYVVLFFGFVNWFKGADIFASHFADTKKLLGRRVRFIMAGGESATLKEKEYYKAYFKSVAKHTEASKSVELTGYVPQKKISQYFSAADLVIFPYREFMCASGVLSLTFSYKKPFIISRELEPMLQSSEFASAIKEMRLKSSEITFELNKKAMIKTTEKVLKNGLKKKLITVSKLMREQRSFEKNVVIYEELLKNEALLESKARALAFE